MSCGDCSVTAAVQADLDAAGQLLLCDLNCMTDPLLANDPSCNWNNRYQACRLCNTDINAGGYTCPDGSIDGCSAVFKQCGGRK